MNQQRTPLISRPARVPAALFLGITLLAIGSATTWVMGTFLATGDWPNTVASTVSAIGEARLTSTPAVLAAALLCLAGLALLLSALIPGRRLRRAVFRGEVPGVTAVSDREFRRYIEERVERVDGVQRVHSRLRGPRLTVIVRTPIDDVGALCARSRAVAEGAVSELQPARAIRSRVRVVRAG